MAAATCTLGFKLQAKVKVRGFAAASRRARSVRHLLPVVTFVISLLEHRVPPAKLLGHIPGGHVFVRAYRFPTPPILNPEHKMTCTYLYIYKYTHMVVSMFFSIAPI